VEGEEDRAGERGCGICSVGAMWLGKLKMVEWGTKMRYKKREKRSEEKRSENECLRPGRCACMPVIRRSETLG
jgi:hypothetical protein